MNVFHVHIFCFLVLFSLMVLWRSVNRTAEQNAKTSDQGDSFVRALYLAKSGKYVSRSGWLSADPMKTYFVVYGWVKNKEQEEPNWFVCDSVGNCEIYEPTEADKIAEDWFVVK